MTLDWFDHFRRTRPGRIATHPVTIGLLALTFVASVVISGVSLYISVTSPEHKVISTVCDVVHVSTRLDSPPTTARSIEAAAHWRALGVKLHCGP